MVRGDSLVCMYAGRAPSHKGSCGEGGSRAGFARDGVVPVGGRGFSRSIGLFVGRSQGQ